MVAHWKCEEYNPEITGSQSRLEADGNTMKQPNVLAVPYNVQKCPWRLCLGVCLQFYLLSACSRKTQSWMEGKTSEKRFRKAFRNKDLEKQTKIFLIFIITYYQIPFAIALTLSVIAIWTLWRITGNDNAVINRLEGAIDKNQKHGTEKVSRDCPHSDCHSCLL